VFEFRIISLILVFKVLGGLNHSSNTQVHLESAAPYATQLDMHVIRDAVGGYGAGDSTGYGGGNNKEFPPHRMPSETRPGNGGNNNHNNADGNNTNKSTDNHNAGNNNNNNSIDNHHISNAATSTQIRADPLATQISEETAKEAGLVGRIGAMIWGSEEKK
jgi:hypothetical protein